MKMPAPAAVLPLGTLLIFKIILYCYSNNEEMKYPLYTLEKYYLTHDKEVNYRYGGIVLGS